LARVEKPQHGKSGLFMQNVAGAGLMRSTALADAPPSALALLAGTSLNFLQYHGERAQEYFLVLRIWGVHTETTSTLSGLGVSLHKR